jgi:hypothetical protein
MYRVAAHHAIAGAAFGSGTSNMTNAKTIGRRAVIPAFSDVDHEVRYSIPESQREPDGPIAQPTKPKTRNEVDEATDSRAA